MLTPSSVSPPTTFGDDRRVGHLIHQGATDDALAVIVGFPSDAGVVNNGGRAGAAHAPGVIRKAFFAMAPGSAGAKWYGHVSDLGDLVVSGDVLQDQKNLAKVLKPYIESKTICVILGGGHETAYGHYLGYVACDQRPHIINWDAHADVRPAVDGRPTSGTSFRLALEHPTHAAASYSVAGLLPHAVAQTHIDYLHQRECEHLWAADVTPDSIDELFAAASGKTMVSFDLDAVDQASCPGVSAPAAGGLSVDLWLRAAYAAGLSSSVHSMDLCEMNPNFDVDNQSARIAALTVWQFMSGCSTRHALKRFIRNT